MEAAHDHQGRETERFSLVVRAQHRAERNEVSGVLGTRVVVGEQLQHDQVPCARDWHDDAREDLKSLRNGRYLAFNTG